MSTCYGIIHPENCESELLQSWSAFALTHLQLVTQKTSTWNCGTVVQVESPLRCASLEHLSGRRLAAAAKTTTWPGFGQPATRRTAPQPQVSEATLKN